MSNRTLKINSLLEIELGQILNRKIELPKDCLITLTGVETMPDLREARVWISVLPELETRRVFKELNRKKSEIQKILHKKLFMNPLPKLQFRIDKTEVHATRMDRILDNLEI